MALEEQGGLFDWCRPTDNARAKLHRTPQRRFLAPSVTRQRPSSSRRSCELFADPGDALQTLTCVSSRKCALQSLGMMPNAAAKTKRQRPIRRSPMSLPHAVRQFGRHSEMLFGFAPRQHLTTGSAIMGFENPTPVCAPPPLDQTLQTSQLQPARPIVLDRQPACASWHDANERTARLRKLSFSERGLVSGCTLDRQKALRSQQRAVNRPTWSGDGFALPVNPTRSPISTPQFEGPASCAPYASGLNRLAISASA